MTRLPDYAELYALSNFSFQQGASHPEELVARAHALGYRALALTDECSVAGVVRAHTEAQRLGLAFMPGALFDFSVDRSPGHLRAGWRLVLLPRSLAGWGDLCTCISQARRAAAKGQYRLGWAELQAQPPHDCEAILVPVRGAQGAIDLEAMSQDLAATQAVFHSALSLGLQLGLGVDDLWWQSSLEALSARCGVPLVATGGVLMHVRSRKPLQDVLTALRLGATVPACGRALQANAEAHLRSRLRLATLYPPAALARTLVVAGRCRFSLTELRYRYPQEAVPPGWTARQTLAHHTQAGAARRYPQGVPELVQAQITRELAVIAELGYEMYFLTVFDLVRFARSRDILCQGRGSAANSVVCYCLGVTEVDPTRQTLLFERFISRARAEPPDIDVDFEHQRREEVIQYLYQRYGRDRAALAATVICYRPRSALRDAGRALGVDPQVVDRLARSHFWFDGASLETEATRERLLEAGLDPDDLGLRQWLRLASQLLGFPRHLSQHVGGFVLTEGPLTRLVPVENAAMPERTLIQWDKDDLDAMGLLKVDVLALGMLSALRRGLALVAQRRGRPFGLQDIPADDVATYDMVCAADTMGVFQIESRAQMSMLPRLQPRNFYDLVVEVAIVRPGPIQGGMVHPYLRQRERLRQGLPPDACPYPSLDNALRRTLGVPIFQEQVMQIAMLAAGFSADEADQLRRSMAAWRRKGGVHRFYDRIVQGMVQRAYPLEFAQRIFAQIEGFGEYGFPESHAASFALLVYTSSWLKCHEPAAFLVALLNSQPLGFYTPSQLVQDAQRHGVEVRPVCVQASGWDHQLHERPAVPGPLVTQPAVRLGLRLVQGLPEAVAHRLISARQAGPFTSVDDLARRAGLQAGHLKLLAGADALAALAGHRRQQVWAASALQAPPPLLQPAPVQEPSLALPPAPEGEELVFDYAATGLTLRRHPLALLRPRLARRRFLSAAELAQAPQGRLVRVCGIVTVRQQPGTAKGVVFVTLEDETGTVNVIVWPSLRRRHRQVLLQSQLLAVSGVWQCQQGEGEGRVRHLIAGHLQDFSPWLGRLADQGLPSRNFH